MQTAMRSSIPGERRVYTRVETEGLAVVRRHGRFVGAYDVRNMSVGGALLDGRESLPVGERLHMTLHLQPTVIELHARVVRRAPTGSADDGGYGISFDVAARVLSAIDDHVRARHRF